MRIFLVASLLLSAAAARADSRTQLQVGVAAGSYFAGAGAYLVSPSVSIGIEDGSAVWLLGIGGYVSHQQIVTGSLQLTDGTTVFKSANDTTVTVAINPGYRKYLGDFESGFAPLVEGALQLGAAHSTGSYGPASTVVGLGASAGFGGEARFTNNLAITARVFAQLNGTRRNGGGEPALYGASLGIGTAAGLTLRF